MQRFYIASFFVLVTVVSVTLTNPTDKEKDAFKKIFQECQSDPATRLDDSVLEKMNNHESVQTEEVIKFSVCFNKKLGLIDAAGGVNKDKLRWVAGRLTNDKNKENEVVQKCSVKASATPEEAITALHDCIHSILFIKITI